MQIITALTGTVLEGDPTLDALKVACRQPEAQGAFMWSRRSGLLTGLAADAGILAWHWTNPAVLAVLDLIRIRATVTTPPTTAQEWGLSAALIYNVSVESSGGGVGVPGARKRLDQPDAVSPGVRYSVSTAALTLGTWNNGPDFISDIAWELAAGATVARSKLFLEKDYADGNDSPIILGARDGILIKNSVLMGAAFVIRVSFEIAWHEVDPSEL